MVRPLVRPIQRPDFISLRPANHNYGHWYPVTGWPWLLLLIITAFVSAVAADDQASGLVVSAIPSADGHEVWVWAVVADGADPPISGLLCDSISVTCWTMTCASSICLVALTDFPPESTVEGQLSITLTLSSMQTLESGPHPFIRAFVPASEPVSLVSPDNLLELSLFPNGLPVDTYLLIMATAALAGPPPPGHRLVGQPYSIRASGALVQSDSPMALRLAYDPLWFASRDAAHSLSIFSWDAVGQTWLEQGGTLFFHQNHLSLPIQQFTTYTLMEIPAWRDTFADASGLSAIQDTQPTPQGGLILSSEVLSGTATSLPIIPTTSVATWGQVVFTHTASMTMSVGVDILNLDGSVLRDGVTNGESLADLDPALYPALKLRSRLSTALAGASPVLEEWRITWTPDPPHQVFLPVVIH